MSEQAPRRNDFQANTLAHEQAPAAKSSRDAFEDAIYGDARTRVREAEAYENHLRKLAETSADTEETMPSESDALRRQENALSEAFQANPQLRRMDLLSQQIHELKDKQVDEASAMRDSDRLINLENKLNEMLVEYAESPEYDENIADMLMDRDDAEARYSAEINALTAKQRVEKTPNVIEEENDDDTLPPPSETDTREIPRRRGARVLTLGAAVVKKAYQNRPFKGLAPRATGLFMADSRPNDRRRIPSGPVRGAFNIFSNPSKVSTDEPLRFSSRIPKK